ncbi:Uncharacterised protein [BD1-7 clade bacterium]|uniref:FlgO domain-containing protein n=1 Tax=BD1-7 clade bacterium TaxID=2029982 RepID=A0A5S9PIM2_9GAMM|nr:Uncharacterised protein [BD1-7 clade bacterium]CAA0103677.1 Uncharacterised protein [BD1-7 clade bacterium]
MKKLAVVAVFLSMFAGCAIQPVDVESSYWMDKDKKVGVVVSRIPEAYTHKTGGQGLLDVAINNAVAGPVTDHLRTLDLDEFADLKKMIADRFTDHGIETVIIEEDIDISTLPDTQISEKGFAKKDYSSLKTKYQIDDLVVIHVVAMGSVRSYYGFIPTSDPKGYFVAAGRLVDLDNHALLWYHDEVRQIEVTGDWDQEDEQYPNLT